MLAIGLVAFFVIRRGRVPTDLQAAYEASSNLRDRLAREVAAPSASPGSLEVLADKADGLLRAIPTTRADASIRRAVDGTLRAVEEVRAALGLGREATGVAHAATADVEAALLNALAVLDAALGPLRTAAQAGGTGSAQGFS